VEDHGSSIDSEPAKLYPGGQASTATQWDAPEEWNAGLILLLLHSKYPRAMNLVTCGIIRIERGVLPEKRLAQATLGS
jgi:hypothetical protein